MSLLSKRHFVTFFLLQRKLYKTYLHNILSHYLFLSHSLCFTLSVLGKYGVIYKKRFCSVFSFKIYIVSSCTMSFLSLSHSLSLSPVTLVQVWCNICNKKVNWYFWHDICLCKCAMVLTLM